jgi:5-methylcytosine-specific restriction endonuclease McrA
MCACATRYERSRTSFPMGSRAKRRARACGYEGPHFTGAKWLALLEACGHRRHSCSSSEDPTVDHIIPLGLGGFNTIENVQVLCAACNSEKGDDKTDYRTA